MSRNARMGVGGRLLAAVALIHILPMFVFLAVTLLVAQAIIDIWPEPKIVLKIGFSSDDYAGVIYFVVQAICLPAGFALHGKWSSYMKSKLRISPDYKL